MRRPDGRIDPGGRRLECLDTAMPSLRDEWRGDSSKRTAERKLASLDPKLRPRIERVIEGLARKFKNVSRHLLAAGEQCRRLNSNATHLPHLIAIGNL